jgi:hypothetical protein
MAEACRTCDFFLDGGLASASSLPTKKSDLRLSGGICRRHAPVIVPDIDLPIDQRSQFPIVDSAHWCGDFRNEAWSTPC